MNKYFEIAIMITIAITFANGAMVSLGPSLFNSGEGGTFDNLMTTLPDIRLSDENVSALGQQTETTIKESNPVEQMLIYLGAIVGTVTNSIGGIAIILSLLFSFTTAYVVTLEFIFGDIPILWTFMQWTIIPFLNLMQVLSIIYILIYIIATLRGGSA